MARPAMKPPAGLAVARGGMHYHDHLVDIARQRLGRPRADILLSDAGRRAETHRKALGRALGGEVRRYQRDDRQLLAVLMHGDAPVWVGAEFEIPYRLPETLQTLAIGQPLGDVVSGTGADGHVIEAIGPGGKGDRLRIETRLIPARSIGLPLRHRLAGPFRRAWRISAEEWRSFGDRSCSREPTAADLRFEASLLAVSVMGLILCLAAAAMMAMVGMTRSEGRLTTLLGSGALVLTSPMFMWLASGLFMGLRIDAGRWLRNRRTP